MDLDALVVGAGPAGLLAAREIASRGFSVKVIEEHKQIGVPCHCAGLVSIEGLKLIDVEASRFVQNDVYGGKIFSPDGQCIEVKNRRPRAYVITRAEFDQYLAGQATDAGAEIILGRKVERFTTRGDLITGASGQGWTEEAHVVVDAEGPSRRLTRKAGLADRGREPLLGVNTEIEIGVDPEIVEVWFGSETAPGFFAWVIPISDERARIGLATSEGDPTKLLERFIKKRFGNAESPSPRAGQVLVDGPVARTSYPGLLLVGDAAGQVKPTTGGGVVLGGLCAIEAGKIAAKSLESGNMETLVEYDEAWRSLYGSEFRSMQTLRSLADRLSDVRMNRFFHAFKKAGLSERVNELVAEGDMDMQEGVIRRAFSEPRLVKAVIGGLGRLALDELRGLVNL